MNTKNRRDPIKYSIRVNALKKDVIRNCEKIILKRVIPQDFTSTTIRRVYLFNESEEVLSSARYIKRLPDATKRVELESKSPNIRVTFAKRTATVVIQRAYDRGDSLIKLNEIGKELEKYLKSVAAEVS